MERSSYHGHRIRVEVKVGVRFAVRLEIMFNATVNNRQIMAKISLTQTSTLTPNVTPTQWLGSIIIRLLGWPKNLELDNLGKKKQNLGNFENNLDYFMFEFFNSFDIINIKD